MQRDEYERIAAVEAAHWWYAATRALLEQTLAPHVRPGGRVLDAGSGPGATGSWLARHGRLVAADVEPLALELHRAQGHQALRAAASLEQLPFADASFAAALCVTVLYHAQIADPRVAVRELARVVEPGGVVCLLEPGVRRLRRAHDRITHTARRFARADLRALLEDAGLRPLRVTGAYSFLVPPALVKAALERDATASDLDTGRGLAGAVLGGVAALERRWLRDHDLPGGLSIVALGVK
jgi:SAM-dependent methyltransferase